MIVFLDTGVLGLLTHRSANPEVEACRHWLRQLVESAGEVRVPEIADYELRRKLLHLGYEESIVRLDNLAQALGYDPISTAAMRRAASLWADARTAGLPRAGNKALDADVVPAAQVLTFDSGGDAVLVATTNIGHLERFVTARSWSDVR